MKTFCAVLFLGISFSLMGAEPAVLKDVFANDFLVGAALNSSVFTEKSAREAAIVEKQFNTISPEDVLKWESVHPEPGKFDFSAADRYVEFGVKNKMFIVGHNLIWHSQTPAWVFKNADGTPADRETLLQRMHEHISTVVGHYKGRIGGWDVVNEALETDGTLRNSPWRKIIGDDYIVKAFQYAHAADPKAELYYNDYSCEDLPKRNGMIALLKMLQAQGVKITGMGLQGHYRLDGPPASDVDAAISAVSKLGLKVMITELDIDVLPRVNQVRGADVSVKLETRPELDPYTNGLPDSVQQQLAQRYGDLFSVFVKHHGEIARVTFWGVADGDSWLNRWPIPGRTSYPLLFDREGKRKLAFDSVIKTAQTKAEASLAAPNSAHKP
jgi:endo-1,4-beta-xylanase